VANYNLGTAHGIIQLDYKGGTATKQAAADLNKVKDTGNTLHPVLKKLAVGAGAALAGGFAVAVKSAATFEKGLSGIQAVSGASAAEMEKVRAKALQLGADTAFSAQDAASAIEELVKAGVPIAGVMNGAADATVALAAAGGVDLPTAATIAANAMNQFGLSAEQMPGIADKIAGAANASAIDVNDFGMSMSQAGAVAHLAGLSFDDTALAITAMGNAGIKGSDAGTSLKTFLQNLQPSTKKQTELMKELGIVTADGGNKFFDASGKIKSMSQIAGVLGGALEGMSDKQKTATLETLFGSDAIRAAAVIAGEGSKGMDTLATSIGKIKAADVAKTRMDNLAGSVEQLKGSAETALISLGSAFTPFIRTIVDGLTGVINKVTGLLPKVIDGIQVFWRALTDTGSNAGSALGPLVQVITNIGRTAKPVFDAVIAAFQNVVNFVKGPLWTIGSTLVQIFGPIIAGAVGLAVIAFSKITEVLGPVGTALMAVAQWARDNQVLLRALAVAVLAGVVAWQAYKGVIALINMIKAAVVGFRVAMMLLNATMLANPIGVIIVIIAALVAAFIWLWNNVEGFRNFWIAVWNGIKNAAMAVANWFTTTLPAWFAAVWNSIKSGMTSFWNTVIAIWNGIRAYITSAINNVRAVISGVMSAIRAVWNAVWNGIRNAAVAVWNGIRTVVTTYINAVRNVISTVLNLIKAIFTGNWAQVRAITSNAMNAIRSVISSVWNAIRGVINGVLAGIRGLISSAWNWVRSTTASIWAAVVNAVRTAWTNLTNVIKGGIASIKGFFAGAGSWLIDAGRRIIEGLLNGIKSMIGSVKDALGSLTNLLPDWKGPKEKDAKLLRDNGSIIIQSLIDGFLARFSDVRSTLGSLTDVIPTSINASVTQVVGLNPASAGVIAPTRPTTAGSDQYTIEVRIDPSDLAGLQQVEKFVASVRQQARMRQGVNV
jgi:TP901 family phage tail tape measure protein